MLPMRTISSSVHAALVSRPPAKSFCMAGASLGENRKKNRLSIARIHPPFAQTACHAWYCTAHCPRRLVASPFFLYVYIRRKTLFAPRIGHAYIVSSLGPKKNREGDANTIGLT